MAPDRRLHAGPGPSEARRAMGRVPGERWHGGPVPPPSAHGSLVPVEFSATANVLPGRHLSVVMPRGEGSVEASQGVVHREVGWTRLVAREAEQAPLTTREHEVITLVSAGLQGGEIATRLGVSPRQSSHTSPERDDEARRAHACTRRRDRAEHGTDRPLRGTRHRLERKLTQKPPPVRLAQPNFVAKLICMGDGESHEKPGNDYLPGARGPVGRYESSRPRLRRAAHRHRLPLHRQDDPAHRLDDGSGRLGRVRQSPGP